MERHSYVSASAKEIAFGAQRASAKPATAVPTDSASDAAARRTSPSARSTSQISFSSSRAQGDDLRRLYQLQLSLLQGAPPSPAEPTSNALAALQKSLKDARLENERLARQVGDLELAASARERQSEAEARRAEALVRELEGLEECRARLEQGLFELQQLESERDFHQKAHAEARRQLADRGAQDFAVTQLKRELFYREDELRQLRARNEELEATVAELLLFAEQPKSAKDQSPEAFFARKIVALEGQVRRLQEEKLELGNLRVARRAESADGEQPKAVESLKAEIARLQRELAAARPTALAVQSEQLSLLREENARLRCGEEKLNALQGEKRALQVRVDELQLQLSQKTQELLKVTAAKPETNAQLAETNRRLNSEIFRLQEQLRKVESLHREAKTEK